MSRQFESSLAQLEKTLLEMAGWVEHAIQLVAGGFEKWDPKLVEEVTEIEDRINLANVALDDACLRLLALQQPLAADLRLIIAVIKINSDLERMGDQAINIAYNTAKFMENTPFAPRLDLAQMFEQVQGMVTDALDAFVKRDEASARAVLIADDLIDNLKDKITHDILTGASKGVPDLTLAWNLILIARNLERIGDHATNIAEDVIFAISGLDVRHGGRTRGITT